MNANRSTLKEFSQEDIASLDVELKVGILGTVTPEGLPHLTMLSTLMPCSASDLSFGQFTEGMSKQHVLATPKTGFLMMTLERELWRGKALFRETAKAGVEYEKYNNMTMFRYNAYFGVHTVYYLDLVEQSGREKLPMNQIVAAAVKTMVARTMGSPRNGREILSPWARGLFNKVDNLKFLNYIGEDGFPVILPVIQAQALGQGQIAFSTGAYGQEIAAIPANIPAAVFGMTFDMEDVLARGTYRGIRRVGGMACGVLEVDWVYNPMPPAPQQVYPPVPVEAVREF